MYCLYGTGNHATLAMSRWFKLRFRFTHQIANDKHLTARLTIFIIPHDCQYVVESPNAGQLQAGAWNTSCNFNDDYQMTSTLFASRLPTRLGDPASSEGWSRLVRRYEFPGIPRFRDASRAICLSQA
ncbi:uncharacterized protein FFB20_02356 [Fusarium fujikuroi]|uniref:Uncharacterized protein n=1 Tax=Fusarium fujikuroi TaxID=5127 RepID=A0A2H3RPG1_FUSFU|nr:uncharacterized protein FFB20_02356 [Fusarium fujikuroi]SCN85067.1 uncharacterized protein FFC1_04773 [Fusarium fujikuroi]SCO34261.1 uncharacterized protein FFNC_03726 [Fusarium fujikuroi]SCV35710.1 uncharacterized protein FFB14_05689 [Fusarium fujikuroi]VTT55584.1 unnamed protein product [Fusarium fujikuroi]